MSKRVTRVTPLLPLYHRLMGARIGRRVQINTAVIADQNLVEIGDDTVIGGDVTLVCHSKTVALALRAADQLQRDLGIAAEVVDLRTIRPLDVATLAASVAKTNRCVVVEEGWPFCGVGAQVVDDLQRAAFDDLDAPIERVTQADVPMPYNKHLEKAAKPSVDQIVSAVKRVTYRDR